MIRAATPISDDELPSLFAGFETTPLALAVSGGADSMALMHMIARWAAREDVRAAWEQARESSNALEPRPGPVVKFEPPPPWLDGIASLDDLRRSAGPPHVVVLTVDHGLRPEAAHEAACVAREAEILGLACAVLRWDGEKPVTAIQDAARSARRNLMLDVLRTERDWLDHLGHPHGVRLPARPRKLVMAHHQEDQAETFLMRLARGSGLDGLCAMRAHDAITREASLERSHSFSVTLLRPLLGVPKARLVATLQAYGATWIDDASNEDERFERVRIRKALQQLEPLGFTADKIALSARRLADAEMSFVRLLDGADASERPIPAHGMFEDVDLTRPDFASRYTAGRLLRRVLAKYGGAARPAELAQIEQLAGRTTRPGSKSRLGAVTLGGCKVQPFGDGVHYLRVYREGSGEGLPVSTIAAGQTVDWDGRRYTIAAGPSAVSQATIRALGMQGWVDVKRAVPGLGDLGWPAAAVATVPVIECGGEIMAYPVIDVAVRSLRDDQHQIKERWAEYASRLRGADYHVTLAMRPW